MTEPTQPSTATTDTTHVFSVVASDSVMLECSCGWGLNCGSDPYLWDLTDAAARHERENGRTGTGS